MNNCPKCGNPIPMGSNTCQLCGYVIPEQDFYNETNNNPLANYNQQIVIEEPPKKKRTTSILGTSAVILVIILAAGIIFFFSSHHVSCKLGKERMVIFYNDKEAYFCISWPLGNCPEIEEINQTSWSFDTFDKYIENYQKNVEATGGSCSIR